MHFQDNGTAVFGTLVSNKGVHPLQNNLAAIQNAPAPAGRDALRSFLGMVGFCAKFIPCYTEVFEPLRDLLQKDIPFVWDIRRQASFEELKRLLTSKCLRLFDPALETIVTTDGSTVSLGAVLQQCQGKELVTITFASKRLTDQEKKYSIDELEALACMWTSEHWRVYL